MVPSIPPAQDLSVTRPSGGVTKPSTWKVQERAYSAQEAPMHPRVAAVIIGFGGINTSFSSDPPIVLFEPYIFTLLRKHLSERLSWLI